METSLFVAKIFGPLYIVVGIGMFISAEHYKQVTKDFMNNTALLFFGGAAAFVTGLLIVIFHNVWVASWEVLITLLGWIAIVKGGLLLIAPNVIVNQIVTMKKIIPFGGVFALVIGGILTYVGFAG